LLLIENEFLCCSVKLFIDYLDAGKKVAWLTKLLKNTEFFPIWTRFAQHSAPNGSVT